MSLIIPIFKFPDRVLIHGTILGIYLGCSDQRPDEIWVASLGPDGGNRFDWIPKADVKHAPPPRSSERIQPSAVAKELSWACMLLEDIKTNEDEMSALAAATIETIVDRLDELTNRLEAADPQP